MKPFKIESLGRAIRLSIAAYIWGIGLVAIAFWNLLFFWVVFFFAQPIESLPLLLLPLIAFVVGLISFWFGRIIYSWLLNFLWSEAPHWLHIGGLRSGFRAYLEVFLITLPIAFLWFLHAGFTGVAEYQQGIELQAMTPPDFLMRWFWLFLLSAVSYCHFTKK